MSNGVTYPQGFRAVAVEAAVKKPGRNDLVVIASDRRPCVAAATFTRNLFAAAPVVFSRKVIAGDGCVRAIVVNSGNANAGTGDKGLHDAEAMASMTASGLGIAGTEVLVASTGVIGRAMPMDRVAGGIERACLLLRSDWKQESEGDGEPGDEESDTGLEVARAIMTTDTVPKLCSRTLQGRSGEVRIGGMCKGAGMIHPDMATMLAFITTDASLSAEVLRPILSRAVGKTFNAISVDNDMSTNDSVFLLANGSSGEVDADAFEDALTDLCRELALKIVADGEGATKVVTISVTGARTDEEAALAADAVATSMLVKTALHGNDPNWGRILAAVGRSGAMIDTRRIRIGLAGFILFEDGLPTSVDLSQVSAQMKVREVSILVEIGLASGSRTVHTTDLSREYISINADYTT